MRRALFVVWLTGVVACSHSPRKTDLTRLPASVGPIVVADDARSYAYIVKGDAGWRLVHQGVTDAPYPAIGIVAFSPVTHRLFYWAGNPADPQGDGFLVVDGARLGSQFARDSDIVFSPDGARWATTGEMRGRRHGDELEPGHVIVLADGRELGRYPDASLPAISPDGRHIAYLAATDDGTTNLVVDGAERDHYDQPDLACSARAKPRVKGKNPQFWPQFQVRYLSDGRLLVMTRDRDGWGIYRDGTRLASYESSRVQAHPTAAPDCGNAGAVAAWSLAIAAKAPVAAWFERVDGPEERWRVVRDGKPVDGVTCAAPYLRQPPELSPDGTHVAYACRTEGPDEEYVVVADGRRYGPHRDIWAYLWSDDGAHFAYGGSTGMPPRPWQYYVDGDVRTEPFGTLWRPRFVPGTARLVWEAELEPREQGRLGIDRTRMASFDEVVWGPEFTRRGTVSWVIRRGRRLTRLDLPTR